MNKTKRLLIPFIISSILMIVSIFFSSKICAIGLLQWVLTVGWTTNKTLFKSYSVSQFEKDVENKIEDSWKEKKYFQSGLYLITIPLMAVGLIIVGINIVVTFFYR